MYSPGIHVSGWEMMPSTPEADCLITDLLELENITFESLLFCSLDDSLIFLPEGHIFKSQMVLMMLQNSVFIPME